MHSMLVYEMGEHDLPEVQVILVREQVIVILTGNIVDGFVVHPCGHV